MEVFQRVMSGEKVTNVEAVFVARDGKEISVMGNINCKFADGKPVYTRGIFRDITERKAAEQALEITNKKLQLLSGITRHDIFNKITGLVGYTDLIGEIVPDDSEVQNYLDNIIKLITTIEEQVRFTADYEDLGMQPSLWQRVDAVVERAASGRYRHAGGLH